MLQDTEQHTLSGITCVIYQQSQLHLNTHKKILSEKDSTQVFQLGVSSQAGEAFFRKLGIQGFSLLIFVRTKGGEANVILQKILQDLGSECLLSTKFVLS